MSVPPVLVRVHAPVPLIVPVLTLRRAMEFLKYSRDLLKIEDILPFFPDFVLIDDFKEAICSSLEEYNDHIEQLKVPAACVCILSAAAALVVRTAALLIQLLAGGDEQRHEKRRSHPRGYR